MTREIGDERQRLVAESMAFFEAGQGGWSIARTLCNQIEQDGKCLAAAMTELRIVASYPTTSNTETAALNWLRSRATACLAALASHSEGNKKGDEYMVADAGNGFYRVRDPQGDVVGTFISREHADEYAQRCTARLASRPQEQPRKATGEQLKDAARAFDEYPSAASPYVNGRLTPNGCARLEAAINAALAAGNNDGHA